MKDPIKLNTVFMGTSHFAASILDGLIEKQYNIVAAYTSPDKKVGREQKLEKSAVKELAEKNKLTIMEPLRFDAEEIKHLQSFDPDIIIVADYGRILPKGVLEIPGFGAINVHASLLPKFRGPSPVQNAILEGETMTGVTIMIMNEGIDTGEILTQRNVPIDPEEKYPELLEKMAKEGTELLLETLPLWVEREISARPQNEIEATQCQLIERSDGHIIWTDSAKSIYNRFRAFYPWPGIFTYWENKGTNLRLKLLKISLPEGIPLASSEKRIGEIFEADGQVAVQTGEGPLVIGEVQLEGKSKSSAADFKNGHPNFIGSFLK